MSPFRPARLTAALLGVAVAAGATGAVVHEREQQQAAAERAELAAATTTLASAVSQLRHAVAAPAHDAQQTTASLRVLVAEAITGSDRAPADVLADIERVADQLRGHADRLEDAAATPLPPRPEILPVGVDPLFARLEPLDEQVRGLAEHLRGSADRVERLAGAATALHAAAADYAAAAGDVPEGEDPDVHATAWRNELERLATYRAEVDQAADHTALGGLATAHAGLLDALEALASDAVAELEAGDVEGYNARVAAGVDDDVVAAWREGLSAGADAALDAPAVDHLDRSRAFALGLVKELDNVRRSSHSALDG